VSEKYNIELFIFYEVNINQLYEFSE